MDNLQDDINHIRVTLDNLSYVMYKEIKVLKKMLLMKLEDINKIYPEIKKYDVEERDEPILLARDKFYSACPLCSAVSVSTGIIITEHTDLKYEFECGNHHKHLGKLDEIHNKDNAQ